jgi:hypothetical protein
MLTCRSAGAGGNVVATAPINQDLFCPGGKNGFEIAGLLKRINLDLIEADYSHQPKAKNDQQNPNPPLHYLSFCRHRSARAG